VESNRQIMPGDPFAINPPLTPLSRAALIVARPLLDVVLDGKTLREIYRKATSLETGTFAARALRALDVRSDLEPVELAHIPAQGPAIVAANHPHGALDGLVLATAVQRVRADVKLLANRLLSRVPELQDLCFFVDPFGSRDAGPRSRAGLRQAIDWLQQGHALIVFPAGEVAHTRGARQTRIDSRWLDTFARLAVRTNADVVPAFVAGANSALFYTAGKLHPRLRTALLPRELALSRGRRVAVRFAPPVRHLPAGIDAVRHVASTTRAAVDQLGHEADAKREELRARFSELEIASEVASLPTEACLIEAGRFAVFHAPASLIPRTLDEIGRLRELTYRAVGEGTGHDRDLDRFDQYYTHLFVWDRQVGRLVGAYRIGDVRRVVHDHGMSGLYTRQLFQFDERFIQSLGPALELGRSWVRAEYQRHSNALLMLWRGIGKYVVERSTARVLFGPVSISARYSNATHTLLRAFLAQNHRHQALADLVEATHLTVARPGEAAQVGVPRTIADADALVSTLESDGKGMPVLLRQYLKLNARLIGFNVDRDFRDALDALMMVDLADVDRAVLTRYLGADVARTLGGDRLAA
jgi:putative hemolysin